ncbi:MAG TPA: dTDP-4-dehydrorhamnose 3,5-epimerase family protein [Polyangia bacterium]
MRFRETSLSGVYVTEQEIARDQRGGFARFFCAREYEERGLDSRVVQCSVSYNDRRGTLRGLHYQADPNPETKTVRCLTGAAYDVVADLRPGSPTRHRWFGLELRAGSGLAVYIPAGCAHGFITLEDDTSLEYLISDYYISEAARGVRYDDPTLAIRWPIEPIVVSDRDRSLPTIAEGDRG